LDNILSEKPILLLGFGLKKIIRKDWILRQVRGERLLKEGWLGWLELPNFFWTPFLILGVLEVQEKQDFNKVGGIPKEGF